MRISAGVAIYYNNKILLAHPTKTKIFGTWTIPKGGIEEGETKLQAAIRETKEEVGIKINPNRIVNKPILIDYINKKGKLFKKVYIFSYHVKSLKELKLDNEVILSKNLQKSEVDLALFFDMKSAKDYIFWRYKILLNN